MAQAEELLRFRINSYSRVSAEFSNGVGEDIVTVRTDRDSPWQVEMSPFQARALARRLTKMASIIDPPKKRK